NAPPIDPSGTSSSRHDPVGRKRGEPTKTAGDPIDARSSGSADVERTSGITPGAETTIAPEKLTPPQLATETLSSLVVRGIEEPVLTSDRAPTRDTPVKPDADGPTFARSREDARRNRPASRADETQALALRPDQMGRGSVSS